MPRLPPPTLSWLAGPQRLSTFYKLNLSRHDTAKVYPKHGLVNYMVQRPGGLKAPRRTTELSQPDLSSDTQGTKAQGLAKVPTAQGIFKHHAGGLPSPGGVSACSGSTLEKQEVMNNCH